jgi:tetratricopeptide (TPR) repeat protein
MAEADSILAVAETKDPGWLSPKAERGWLAYRRSRLGGMDRSQYEVSIGRGLAFADSALAIDPADASAVELQATLRYWKYLLNLAATPQEADQLYSQADSGFRAAIAADPNRASALTSLSHLLLNRGDVAEAKMTAMRAYQADPFLENTNLTLWRIFTASWSLADVVEAQRACEDGVRRFPQDYRFAQCRLMLLALPDQKPDIDAAWPLVEQFALLSPPQVSDVNRQRGLMYMAMGLARASLENPALADSARAVAVRGRADPSIDPLRETAWLESMARTILGDTDEAVRQLSAYLAANPSAMESYRKDAEGRELEWYHRPLLDEPRFRTLLGLR